MIPLPLSDQPAVPRRQVLAALALAIGLGIGAYLVTVGWQRLFPPAVFSATAGDCDLQRRACSAAFGDDAFISLEIAPRPIRPTQPLRVLVESGGIKGRGATVEFTGVDMNMGVIRADMLDTGGGSFAGDTTLPVCVRRGMAWRAIVLLDTADGVYRADFQFDTRNH